MSHAPVALITGSSRDRLGQVVARGLAADGYRIAVHYHSSQAPAEAFAAELQEAGSPAIACQADLREESGCQQLVRQVAEKFDRLDAVIAMASTYIEKPLAETTAEDCLDSFRINTLGTFFVAKAAGEVMTGQVNGGTIVTFGDWAIEHPYRDHAAYFLGKGAIPTLTRVLANELAARNRRIRVAGIHPGPVMLPPDTQQDEKQALENATVLRRVESPESILAAVRFLLTADFVTGEMVHVDGGRSQFNPVDR